MDESALAIFMFFSEVDENQQLGMAAALPSDQATNPNTEGRKMKTYGQTIRAREVDLGKAKAWAKRTFTRERVAVAAAKFVVAGYFGIVPARAFQTY